MIFSNDTLRIAVEEWIENPRSAEATYGHISSWDTSKVTDMRDMFHDTFFNQPLDKWDVSNVTDMSGMFKYATIFNQPLNNWDTSKVTDMRDMFNCSDFNQPLDNWDVSNVTDMSGMFESATTFNQPLNNWDTSKVTDMREMFNDACDFNQPLDNWDVSKVNDMTSMFVDATAFKQDISGWDVSKIKNKNEIFDNGVPFDQYIKSLATTKKIETIRVESNLELRTEVNKFLEISNQKITIKDFKINFIYNRGSRLHCLVGDYEGYMFFSRPSIGLKQEEVYDPGNGIGNYIQDLANGGVLNSKEEIIIFMDKLGHTEINDLMWPEFCNEDFYMMDGDMMSSISEGCVMEEATPNDILQKFNEDEDFFYENVRNFIEYGDEMRHYAFYKGETSFGDSCSVISSIKFVLNTSNKTLEIDWVYDKKINDVNRFPFKFSRKHNLCDNIVSVLYRFLIEKPSKLDLITFYASWKSSIGELKNGDKDFNNLLIEACHFLVFDSKSFGKFDGNIIKSRMNELKKIDMLKAGDIADFDFQQNSKHINIKLNLYLGLYVSAVLKFIDENNEGVSIEGEKIEELKSFNLKLVSYLTQVDELFRVLK
jgi:surface protein